MALVRQSPALNKDDEEPSEHVTQRKEGEGGMKKSSLGRYHLPPHIYTDDNSVLVSRDHSHTSRTANASSKQEARDNNNSKIEVWDKRRRGVRVSVCAEPGRRGGRRGGLQSSRE